MPSKFAKRHYYAIADMLAHETAQDLNGADFAKVVNSHVALFKADNPQFKPAFFREYIGKQIEARAKREAAHRDRMSQLSTKAS
jgi:hypothetical protein